MVLELDSYEWTMQEMLVFGDAIVGREAVCLIWWGGFTWVSLQ